MMEHEDQRQEKQIYVKQWIVMDYFANDYIMSITS